MIDVFTVMRKELLELFGDRHSLRGALIQATVVFLLVGVIVPALDDSIWTDPAAPVLLYVLFPAAIASIIAADAFAGERERRTLETLLATPLRERDVFAGKTLAAVSVSLIVSIASFAAAATITHTPPSLAFAAALAGGAIATPLLMASIAVTISAHVNVARSAQQMAAIAFMVVIAAGSSALQAFGPLSPMLLLRLDLVVAVAALTILATAARSFRRDRLFG